MKKEKTLIWASQILTPFSILDKIHAFLGPLPRSSLKSNKLESFFPCLSYCKPSAFEDKSFELGFMEQPHSVLSSSHTPTMILTLIGRIKWKRRKGIFGKIKASFT